MRKIFLLFGVILIVVFVSGCIDQSYIKEKNHELSLMDNKSVEECNKIFSYPNESILKEAASMNSTTEAFLNMIDNERGICLSIIAWKRKSFGICDLINSTSHDYSNYCYLRVAFSMNNSNMCGIDFTRSELNRDDCFWKLAVENNDLSFCERAGSSKSQCLKDIAVLRRDSRICDTLYYPSYDYRSLCYMDIARRTGNASLCNRVPDGDDTISKTNCLHNAEFYNIVKSKDVSNCDGLNDSYIGCVTIIAQLTNNISICNDWTCISDFAKEKKEPGLCEELDSDSLTEKAICYYKAAVASGNISACEKIDAKYMHYVFYRQYVLCRAIVTANEGNPDPVLVDPYDIN